MSTSVLLLSFLISLTVCLRASGQNTNPALLAERRTVKLNALPIESREVDRRSPQEAQEADAKYLLELQPDRMLAFLRQHAGLKAKAEGYGGWDGPKRNLTGHIAGHYLSAVSLMWAATGDQRFKERADYIVEQLKEIQDAQGDGYIGALEDGEGVDGKQRFVDLSNGVIKSGGFDLNGMWSPWYVQHKLFAGLRDAYRYVGNQTALQVEVKFAGWAEKILSRLSDDQLQQMLGTEFGGMNEVLAELYADTADERWLKLADKFHQKAIVEPLSQDKDVISHTHGNTQVPKLYGVLMRYVYTGNAPDEEAAKYFWDRVVYHYSFATGGHGKNEYFGEPDKLSDMVDGRTAETCNVYNMLKMSRTLFSVEPDIRYADFHERALFNHILASQDPNNYSVTYMLPVGRGVQHEYQRMFAARVAPVGKPRKVDPKIAGLFLATPKGKRHKQESRPEEPVEVQRYVVDYAITPSQLRFGVNSAGIHHGITNFMITSFDEGGVLRTSVASRAISDLKADGYKEILSGGLRLRQQVDVPGSRDVVATRSPGWTDGANGNY